MLGKLESRFQNAGFKNIQFNIINVGGNGSGNVTNTTNNHTSANNITIVNSESTNFAQFDLYSAYVFDHCERLAYIIYSPWSSIQHPYVKASILSTIYDTPCGECDIPYIEPSYPDISTIYSTTTANFLNGQNASEDNLKSVNINVDGSQAIDLILAADIDDNSIQSRSNENITTLPIYDEVDDSNNSYVLPIRIIINAKHMHPDLNENGTFYKYDYMVLRTNDTKYHEHLPNDRSERIKIVELNRTRINGTDEEPVDVSNESKHVKLMVGENGEHYESVAQHTIRDDNGELITEFEDIISINLDKYYNNTVSSDLLELPNKLDSPTISDVDQKNDEHYGKILQWIHFNL